MHVRLHWCRDSMHHARISAIPVSIVPVYIAQRLAGAGPAATR